MKARSRSALAVVLVASIIGIAIVLMELAGFHTPTDILGGLLVAALLIELARAYAD